MKIKTSELTGAALDSAVAKSLGWHMIHVPADANGENAGEVLAPPTIKDGEWVFPPKGRIGPRYFLRSWSSDWSQGGPLIESRKIEVGPAKKGWFALTPCGCMEYGPTPLIAATRSIVRARLGNAVDVPEELV